MTSIKQSTLFTLFIAISGGCDDDSDGPGVEDRDLVFDGAEVRDKLAADPDSRFFVDLTGSDRVRFVQEDVPLDFTNFLVQCPSMPHPIPMLDFASMVGIDLEWPEFSMRSAAAEDVGFRAEEACEEGRYCPDANFDDCVMVCR